MSMMLPPNDDELKGTLRASKKDIEAGNVLFQTIREGTAKVENLKLLVDGFEIIEELGRGAFGVVYRARDERLDRQVAIKISLLDDPRRREQYIKEAKNAAKLDCVGIVPVYQVGTLAGGQPFVVQRLIDGSTLRDLINELGKLDVHHSCTLMKEIALAVAKAHAVGMIHRDLKPDNILIDSMGKPWVADFGLAISEEEQGKHRGEKAGTPLYMSPEQLRGRAEWLDGRTDIYAMGIMLYEMLVGRTPFDAHTLAELEEQVFHRDPKPISQRAPNIHSVMDSIFQNCCAKQVNDRYSNALELVADLDYVLSELPLADTQATNPSHIFGRSTKRQISTQINVSTRRKTLRSTVRGVSSATDVRTFKRPYLWLGVLVIIAVAGYVGWLRISDSKPENTDLPTATDATKPVEAEMAESETTETAETAETASSKSPITARPFRVSKGNEGTHTTIASAVAMAEEGETIYILPGNYVESLSFDRNVKLLGEGNPSDIVIVGQDGSAITIEHGIEVELVNLTLDGVSTGGKEFNTIDVHNGSVRVNKCIIYSRLYDCIKVREDCELQATDCQFRATAHPAINANRARKLVLSDCRFDIKPNALEAIGIGVGIQVINGPGSVHNCTFNGVGDSVGIHWKDTSGAVDIVNSTFIGFDTGVILQNCPQVQLSNAKSNSLVDCAKGVIMQNSSGEIHGLNIFASQGKTAIRIIDDAELPDAPKVLLSECSIKGYGIGLSVEHAHASAERCQIAMSQSAGVQIVRQSKLLMSDSSVTQSELTGIAIEDATAELNDCIIAKNRYAGVLVDADGMQSTLIDCNVEANTSGILVSAGAVAIRGGKIRANSVGVLVLSRTQLGQASTAEDSPSIDVEVAGTNIDENENGGLLIRTPCVYRLDEGSLSDPENDDQPRIDGDLQTEVNGAVTTVRHAGRSKPESE